VHRMALPSETERLTQSHILSAEARRVNDAAGGFWCPNEIAEKWSEIHFGSAI